MDTDGEYRPERFLRSGEGIGQPTFCPLSGEMHGAGRRLHLVQTADQLHSVVRRHDKHEKSTAPGAGNFPGDRAIRERRGAQFLDIAVADATRSALLRQP
jgi:hypothetical protein